MAYKDKTKQRQYQRQWKKKRRDDWLAVNGPCVRCGSWLDLEIDHISRSEKIDHKIWTWSVLRRTVELSKCQVLCSNCHLNKTRRESSTTIVHGTITAYKSSTKHCRCTKCREAVRIYQATFRQRKRTDK